MEIIASLSSVRIEPALSPVATVAVATAAVATAPDAAAVQRFSALMQAPAPEAVSAAAAPSAAQAAATGPLSIGDQMLNSMQTVSTDFRENMTRMSETLRSDKAVNAQQMVGLMLDLQVVGMQMQLATTTTSVLTQKLNELTHLQ